MSQVGTFTSALNRCKTGMFGRFNAQVTGVTVTFNLPHSKPVRLAHHNVFVPSLTEPHADHIGRCTLCPEPCDSNSNSIVTSLQATARALGSLAGYCSKRRDNPTRLQAIRRGNDTKRYSLTIGHGYVTNGISLASLWPPPYIQVHTRRCGTPRSLGQCGSRHSV